MMEKSDKAIVIQTYISKFIIGEGSEPSLFNIGRDSFGKVIGFQDDWVCINFEKIIIDKSVGVMTHEDMYCNFGMQHWIPNSHLALLVMEQEQVICDKCRPPASKCYCPDGLYFNGKLLGAATDMQERMKEDIECK